MTPTELLNALRDDLALPMAADLPPEAAEDWWRGSLVVVRVTGRVAADLYGWRGQPVHLAHVTVDGIPPAGLEGGAGDVGESRPEYARRRCARRQGTATLYVVDRDDIVPPVFLCSLRATAPTTAH